MMSQNLFCCFAFKSHHIWKFRTMESEKQQFEEMHMPHLLILLNACVRLDYQTDVNSAGPPSPLE